MIRQIIKIDSDKCNGCGLCAKACHEGAIAMQNGKAVLIRDDYCDGLGNCLPVCPTGAISFENREALEFNEKAVKKNDNSDILERTQFNHKSQPKSASDDKVLQCGCPSASSIIINHEQKPFKNDNAPIGNNTSELRQFPIQLKLVPISAPYFHNCNLLIAADCTAFAYGNFHNDFIKGKITLIGCPKLDDCDYSDKLTEILKNNDIASITVVRMEVPCCGGLVQAVKSALKKSEIIIPWNIITISRNGEIV